MLAIGQEILKTDYMMKENYGESVLKVIDNAEPDEKEQK